MAGNNVRIHASIDDKVSSGLDKIRDKVDTLGGKGTAASLFGNLGAKGIAKGADLIADALQNAGGAVRGLVESASGLEQAQGAVGAVFEGSASKIDAWAQKAADAAGLSKREVNEMAAVTGASLANMGFSLDEAADKSIELQKRAADMAATYGGPTKDALQAISALMRGERDPIERFGVTIKQVDVNARIAAKGLDTSTSAAKKNAEAVAGLELLMEQTAKTQGRFAAESESLAGIQARLTASADNMSAKLGTKLLPIFVDLGQKVLDLMPTLEGFADAVGPVLATAIQIAFKPLELLAGAIQFVGDTAKNVGDFLGDLALPWEKSRNQIKAEQEQALADANAHVEAMRVTVGSAVLHAADEIEENRGYFRTKSDDMAEELPEAMEAARAAAVKIASVTPQDMADALRDKRTEWQKAVATLGSDLENEMTQTAEIAAIRTALVGDEIVRGLKSKDPVIRAQTNATVKLMLDRLRMLEPDARRSGARGGQAYADGWQSKVGAVAAAARNIAGAVSRYLKLSSPAKEGPLSEFGGPEGWGQKGADQYATAWQRGLGKMGRGLAAGLVGLTPAMGGGGPMPAMAGAGSNAPTINVTVQAHGLMTPGTGVQIAREIGPALKDWFVREGLMDRR